MRRTHRASKAIAVVAAAAWLLAAPVWASGRQGGGRPTSSHPPASGGSGGGGSARPAPSGGSGGGGSARPAPSGGSRGATGGQGAAPRAVPKDSGGSGSTASGAGGTGASGTSSRPTSNRGPDSGTAVGRATQPVNGGAGRPIVIPNGYYGGFYPWGYAGLGFGGYYAGYYGYYDPWVDDGYYAPPYVPVGTDEAELRLKVKPREAQVFVDGFYAGVVDDFDGVFQRLRLDAGPHHIEIRADGYQPLDFDIDARRNRTTTYSGELVKN